MSAEIKEDTSTVNQAAKKELRHKIREQMEFYFSDSNLTKDRFLKKEITTADGGFIDLNTFLRFNKIRLLTSSVDQIAKAVKHSSRLELNEERTMVRRVDTFVEPTQKDIDKNTIYVENLPTNATNEVIKTFFSRFGTVSYISMPKFKTTNQFKGFVFIEFSAKEEAKQAVQFFQDLKKNAMVDEESQEPIGKFPKFNAQIVEIEKKIRKINDEIAHFKVEEAKPAENGKRKAEPHAAEPKDKLKKQEPVKSEPQTQLNFPEHYSNLRCVSKKDWLKSKDDFLSKQKQEVTELKAKLTTLTEQLAALKEAEKKKQEEAAEATKPQPPEDISRGCIVCIELRATEERSSEVFKLSRQQFKERHLAGSVDRVAYVDLDKHTNRIYIRCSSPEAALALLANTEFGSQLPPNHTKSLLSNIDEDVYFGKIATQRSRKQEKKERKQNKQTPVAQSSLSKQTPPVVVKIEKKSEIKMTTARQTGKVQPTKHITFDDDE